MNNNQSILRYYKFISFTIYDDNNNNQIIYRLFTFKLAVLN